MFHNNSKTTIVGINKDSLQDILESYEEIFGKEFPSV